MPTKAALAGMAVPVLPSAAGLGTEVSAFAVAGEATGDNPVASGDTEATFAPDWRPAEGKRTIGEVLGHIADAEAFYAVRLEHPAQPGGSEQPEGPQAAAELWKRYAGRDLGLGPVERLVRTRELVLDRLNRLSDEDRGRVIELRGETCSASDQLHWNHVGQRSVAGRRRRGDQGAGPFHRRRAFRRAPGGRDDGYGWP